MLKITVRTSWQWLSVYSFTRRTQCKYYLPYLLDLPTSVLLRDPLLRLNSLHRWRCSLWQHKHWPVLPCRRTLINWRWVLNLLQNYAPSHRRPASIITECVKSDDGLTPLYKYRRRHRVLVYHRQSSNILTLCQWKQTFWQADWVQNPFSPSNGPSPFTQCDCNIYRHNDDDGTCKQAFILHPDTDSYPNPDTDIHPKNGYSSNYRSESGLESDSECVQCEHVL